MLINSSLFLIIFLPFSTVEPPYKIISKGICAHIILCLNIVITLFDKNVNFKEGNT